MATVTATPSAGRTAGQSGPTGAGDGATSDTGFGDLLAALVPGSPADLTPATSTPPGVCGAGPEVLVQQEDAVVGAADSAPVVVGAAADGTPGSRTGDPGGVVPAADGGPDAAIGTDPTDVLADTEPVPTVDAALLAQAQLAALPLLTPVVAVPVTGATVDATTTADIDPTLDATAAPTGGDVADALPETAGSAAGPSSPADAGGDQPTDQPSGRPTGPAAAPTATPPGAGPAPAVDTPTPVAVVGPGTVTAPAPTTAAAGSRPADAVPGQVFPEVARLSQAGPGTHRVTLRLDPGTLGEVRVTLTVRDGEVQVRLAAQHDAREVLALAAPDLRRLLEQPGIEARVSVADLTSGATTDTTDLGGDGPSGGGRGAGTDPDPDRQAGPYDQPARRTPASAAGAMPGPETAPHARARSGLDLAL